MFNVDGYKIDMHRGDTGAITIRATGYAFGPNDRALFTVRNQQGTVVKQGVYELTDNAFTVHFTNAETDYLDRGTYEWDVRYVVNPTFDGEGNITDGDAVSTPKDPMELNLRRTVGQI